MKLIECYIENFGKLSEVNFKFTDGLNTVIKENAYGKTTLTVFIKAMLYGLDATKKVKLEENDRKHYTPWQGGSFGGTLTYETNGKMYRVERRFMSKASDDTVAIFDMQTGKECPPPPGILGEELFGIDADGFERTVFLSEANLSGKNDNKSISAKLSDLVGVEGDISVMDEATELLEKQRKIYRKRGGAGEIGEIRKRITAIDTELGELERLREELASDERALAEIKEKLKGLYEKRKLLSENARKKEEERLKRTYERQYLKMMESLGEEEKQRALLSEFFAQGVPTQNEINEARRNFTQAQSIIERALDEAPGGEYAELLNFFASSPDEKELETARGYAGEIQNAKSLLNEKEAERKSISSAPDVDAYKKKANNSCLFAVISAVIAIIFGALAFIFMPLIALGAVFGVVSIVLFLKLSKEKAALKEALRALEKRKEADARIKELEDKISSLTLDACNFISRFPITPTDDIAADISAIMRKYDLFLALREREGESEKKRSEALLEAKELKRAAESFLSRFPTKSEDPFDEITAKLLEYNTTVRTIEIIKANIDEFVNEHRLDVSAISADEIPEIIGDDGSEALEEEIHKTEGEKLLIERAAFTKSTRLEGAALLISEKEDLLYTEAEYEKKLDVIQKTASFLVEAKELMTSKYLANTKSAFDKYVSLIGAEDGDDFTMDTSFALMKNEKGASHPHEAFSRGKRDLYALAARLALIDALYEGEKPFIILDDPFAYFDDRSLSAAIKLIKEISRHRQVIYLSCTKARA